MKTFKQNIISIYKEKGEIWLKNLPDLVKKIANMWNLTSLYPMNNLSYHYVLSGFQKKEPIILKLYPANDLLDKEVSALNAFLGCGTVRILDQAKGALLLERAVSGKSLRDHFPNKDRKATDIICKIISKLHQAPLPQKYKFKTIDDLTLPIDRNWHSIPTTYLEKAREFKKYLLKTSKNQVLLHGDLHHDNILANGDRWLVIDPKGFIGEAAYETTAFIRNPMPDLLKTNNPTRIILDRISLSAELLNMDKKRVTAWCFVQSILSHIWCLEDNTDWEYFADLSTIFFRII